MQTPQIKFTREWIDYWQDLSVNGTIRWVLNTHKMWMSADCDETTFGAAWYSQGTEVALEESTRRTVGPERVTGPILQTNRQRVGSLVAGSPQLFSASEETLLQVCTFTTSPSRRKRYVCVCVFSENGKRKRSYPRNIPWRPIGLWDVKDPTLSRQSAHRWR
jgi:hypothetical protein